MRKTKKRGRLVKDEQKVAEPPKVTPQCKGKEKFWVKKSQNQNGKRMRK